MKIALIQLTSELDPKKNIAFIREHAKKAKDEGAEFLFLPECFYSMSNGLEPSPYLVEGDQVKKTNDPHYIEIQNIARDFNLNLIGGSAATRLGEQVVNRAFNFTREGIELPHYDKMNLFSCDIERKGERKAIDEADIYTAGMTPQVIDCQGVRIGLGICFDLRYPEMSRQYVKEGAQILTYPAAFTVPTGRAHWHTLLRARAIENQCFVVASAQVGKHNERIITYGHSLVIDPWGDILLDAKEDTGHFIVDIDLKRINEIRKSVKVFK